MRSIRPLTLALILTALLTACALPFGATPTPIPGAPTAVPTPRPGDTPTPVSPLAVLVLPADLDAELSAAYQQTVYDLSQASGFRFQVLNTLTPADLDPGLRVAVFLRTDPGIAALAPLAPGAQFLAIEVDGVAPGGNISVISDSARPDVAAFVGGYISGMLATDYKAGVILAAGSAAADQISVGFDNGMTYYCGTCSPYYGPFLNYPLAVEIPSEAKPQEYDSYSDYLINNRVDMIYLDPQIAIPELLRYLSSVGVWMMGPFAPEEDYNNWVASLQPDMLQALRSAWPELAAGRGGVTFRAQMTLTNVNPDLLTDGKRAQALQVLDQVVAGLIWTGVNP